MARRKQLDLVQSAAQKNFGGSLLKGNARVKRVVPRNACLHVTLKSSLCKGNLTMRKHDRKIQEIIYKQASRFGVKIYGLENVGNHIHILARFYSKHRYVPFIRSISSLIARLVLGFERGKARAIKFWDYRPFSRIVEWSQRQTITMKRYMAKNRSDVLGKKRQQLEIELNACSAKSRKATLAFLDLLASIAPGDFRQLAKQM